MTGLDGIRQDKYEGKWVAIREGEIIDSHVSKIELRENLIKRGLLAGTAFFRVCKGFYHDRNS